MDHGGLICDGCAQKASAAHIAARLGRLEQSTRFRPVHIRTLLLGGISPAREEQFLYAPVEPSGEARDLLAAAEIPVPGRSKQNILSDFQRLGLFLTHILECPLDPEQNNRAAAELLMRERLPAVSARIRRSLKPGRVLLFSMELAAVGGEFTAEALGCPVHTNAGRPFSLAGAENAAALRQALGGVSQR